MAHPKNVVLYIKQQASLNGIENWSLLFKKKRLRRVYQKEQEKKNFLVVKQKDHVKAFMWLWKCITLCEMPFIT